MILSNNRTEEDRRWAPWKSRGSKWGGGSRVARVGEEEAEGWPLRGFLK